MLETQTKSLKVGKLVDTEHVNTVLKNYKKERWVHNSQRIGKEDSLSVWYSVEELEEYIEKVKEHGADGIKMYFAAYDESYSDHPLYAGRQTVVLVATKQKETESGITNKDVYIPTDNGSSILAYNTGSLCPPFCGNGDDFGGIRTIIIDKGEEGVVIA